jgi:V-type H+-transporting ATPase subunit a
VQFHHLLKKSRKFLGEANSLERADADASRASGTDYNNEAGIAMSPLINDQERGPAHAHTDDMTFSNIAGTLPSADRIRFERMLYRATRGNCYVRFSQLSGRAQDAYGNHIDRVCFIIFYKSLAIEGKIKKICDAFNANRYDLSNLNRPGELEERQRQNEREMLDAKTVLDKNTEAKLKICIDVSKHLEEWLWNTRREKGIYHTLNLFKNDVAGNLLRGRGWILTSTFGKAKSALKRAQASLNLVPTAMIEKVPEQWPTPPTHFNTNKYTWAFQEFVNTYGIPRYREANPALFTAATFPFLFGVMYGDIGHGSVLAIFGLYLIFTEAAGNARGVDEMVKGIYSAKYMLFAMGLMAVYAGFVYNDYFSIGLNLMGSSYKYEVQEEGAPATSLYTYGDPQGVYQFGLDPAWKISTNELLFLNSMKMKMSVILGIFQMTWGILLKGINAYYFKSKLDLLCEFLPMILFDMALFGYMVILIFVKWAIDWNYRMAMGSCTYDVSGVIGMCTPSNTDNCYNAIGQTCNSLTLLADVCTLNYGGTGDGCQPPNLITTLINIALKPGSVDEPMFAGQAGLQTFLLLVAFICVPWLLMVKPLYLRHEHKQQMELVAHNGGNAHGVANPLLGEHAAEEGRANPHGSAEHGGGGHGGGGGGHGHGDGEFNFGEIFIHQAIETIEFVLGMVSNTASYLRLWALSLAHTELAHVFWEKAMISAINTNNPVAIFIGYAVFAGVTFGVLLCMDVLECFLHALRLHWVEFQNKFYKADGYRFQPFAFKLILEKALIEG